MYHRLAYIALPACAALACCRTVTKLHTDGALTEHSIVVISPDTTRLKGKAHRPAPMHMYQGRKGYTGSVNFTVRRAQADDVYIAILQPDARLGEGEMRREFTPSQTRSLTFSPMGISTKPRSKWLKWWPF